MSATPETRSDAKVDELTVQTQGFRITVRSRGSPRPVNLSCVSASRLRKPDSAQTSGLHPGKH
jgi:hypothetical protein